MVKFISNGSVDDGSDTHSVKSSSSCFSVESTQKENSSQATYSSVVNGNCELSNTSLVNGNCELSNTSLVNGNSNKNMSNGSVVNGDCELSHISLVNENSVDKMSTKEVTAVNGHSDSSDSAKVSPVDENEDDSKRNALSEEIGNEVPTKNLSSVNGDCHAQGSENHLNDSNTISENATNICAFDSLQDEKNFENQNGFTKVINKKRRNKNKNHKKVYEQKKVNLPPGLKTENIRRDNKIDKNYYEKTSTTTQLAQKPLIRQSANVINLKKSYSSALVNGPPNTNSPIEFDHTSSALSSNLEQCFAELNKPHMAQISDKFSNHQVKSTVDNDVLASSYKQANSITKVDCFVQTDFPHEMSQSQNKCLPTSEETQHKADSPIDYVEDECDGNTTDESSNTPYCDSVASNDSGRPDSDDANNYITYSCAFPASKVALIIGRKGRFRKELENKSGVSLVVHNLENSPAALLKIEGTVSQIEKVKELIWERFPYVSLSPYLGECVEITQYYLPTLPESTNFMGQISFLYNPGNFWVQQYGHPLEHQLRSLEDSMTHHYNTTLGIPPIADPQIGQIVAVPAVKKTDTTTWIRGSILSLMPGENCVLVRYLDYGGDYIIPIDNLRPMRNEFFSMQFFAACCYLYAVKPKGEKWTDEAIAEFADLCCGSFTPYIGVLYKDVAGNYSVKITGFDYQAQHTVDVGTTLVERGHADFFDPLPIVQPPVQY